MLKKVNGHVYYSGAGTSNKKQLLVHKIDINNLVNNSYLTQADFIKKAKASTAGINKVKLFMNKNNIETCFLYFVDSKEWFAFTYAKWFNAGALNINNIVKICSKRDLFKKSGEFATFINNPENLYGLK